MMEQTFMNLAILILMAVLIYTFFAANGRGFEGMTDMSGNIATTGAGKNGIAGNAANYLATIQAKVIQYQDQFLISKYRTEYENTVLKLGDLTNALMLETALNVDPANPMPALSKLNTLNGAHIALESVMKYIDGSH